MYVLLESKNCQSMSDLPDIIKNLWSRYLKEQFGSVVVVASPLPTISQNVRIGPVMVLLRLTMDTLLMFGVSVTPLDHNS